MADADLKDRIYDILRNGRFKDDSDLVDVSDGDDIDDVHVVVVTRKFEGMSSREKRELILKDLIANLKKKEWTRISLAVGKSPEEIKAGF
jgi:hypothetical protein